MSVFVSQNSVISKFENSDSWVILSSIEKQIKEKIERIGTPLKDWDISINYGIKTGYNEAFIISGEKRKELIEQDPKSTEILRPILRGRDIKRYDYNFADLYIITTFPSLKIDIDKYPAVKQHLLSFGYERLKQTGDSCARKKTNNQWFETQDSIGYWDDFYKQKIVWAELARSGNSFTMDKNGFHLGNTAYIMVIKDGFESNLSYNYLVAVLNSKPILYYLDKISSRLDQTGWRWLRQYVENLPIPLLTLEKQNKISPVVEKELATKTRPGQEEIDSFVYEIYGFTTEEIKFLKDGY